MIFPRPPRHTTHSIFFCFNKRKLIKPSIVKFRYSNSLINTYEVNYIKRWVVSLLSVISKKSNTIRYNNYIEQVLLKIKRKYNLFEFFSIIEKNLTIVFHTFKKKIAGKNLSIPIGLNHYKRVNAMSKLIIISLKLRSEKTFSDKLYNELIDVYHNRGFSINKRINYTKQLKDLITNIRFLNEKY